MYFSNKHLRYRRKMIAVVLLVLSIILFWMWQTPYGKFMRTMNSGGFVVSVNDYMDIGLNKNGDIVHDWSGPNEPPEFSSAQSQRMKSVRSCQAYKLPFFSPSAMQPYRGASQAAGFFVGRPGDGLFLFIPFIESGDSHVVARVDGELFSIRNIEFKRKLLEMSTFCGPR